MSVKRFFSVGIVLSIASLVLNAETSQAKTQHVTLELVSERTSVQSGETFDVGLKFTLEPGWHLYWENPGDSGEPPSVRWSLPNGMKADPIAWPHPERMQLQSIVNYVYSGELLLPVTMHAGFALGKSISIGADVRWLVCREICLPGKAAVNISLPITSSPPQDNPALKSLFAQVHSRIPVPLPDSVRTRTVDEGQQFIVSISPLDFSKDGNTEFFPLVPDQTDNATAPRIAPSGKGLRILLKKSDRLLNPITQLNGVLVLPDGKSFVVNSPVTTVSAKRKKEPHATATFNSPYKMGQ